MNTQYCLLTVTHYQFNKKEQDKETQLGNYSPMSLRHSNIYTNIVNRREGLETQWNYNISHLCFCSMLSSSSRAYCILAQLTNSNVLGKFFRKAIRHLNNWIIQELVLADLTKTQYTRDDEDLILA